MFESKEAIGTIGQVAEWSKAAGCKPAGIFPRWFESTPAQQHNLFVWWCLLGRMVVLPFRWVSLRWSKMRVGGFREHLVLVALLAVLSFLCFDEEPVFDFTD